MADTFETLLAARIPVGDLDARDVDAIVEHYISHPFDKLSAYLNGGANSVAIRCICVDRYEAELKAREFQQKERDNPNCGEG